MHLQTTKEEDNQVLKQEEVFRNIDHKFNHLRTRTIRRKIILKINNIWAKRDVKTILMMRMNANLSKLRKSREKKWKRSSMSHSSLMRIRAFKTKKWNLKTRPKSTILIHRSSKLIANQMDSKILRTMELNKIIQILLRQLRSSSLIRLYWENLKNDFITDNLNKNWIKS